jgi:hypothetical protein
MEQKDKTLIRCVVNVSPDGVVAPSQWFRGSVDDMKSLCAHYGFTPLYCIRLKDVKRGAPGYFEFVMATMGVNFETHGHA